MELLTALGKSKRGAAAIEYGLIAALISVAPIAALATIGGLLSTVLGVSQIRFKECHKHSPGLQIRESIRSPQNIAATVAE